MGDASGSPVFPGSKVIAETTDNDKGRDRTDAEGKAAPGYTKENEESRKF